VCKREYTGREIYAIYGILCHSVFWNWWASSKHGGNEMVGERKKRGGEKRVIINPPRYSQGLRTGIHNHHQLYHILYQFVNPHCVLWGMAQRGKRKSCGVWGRWREARGMCGTRFYPTRWGTDVDKDTQSRTDLSTQLCYRGFARVELPKMCILLHTVQRTAKTPSLCKRLTGLATRWRAPYTLSWNSLWQSHTTIAIRLVLF